MTKVPVIGRTPARIPVSVDRPGLTGKTAATSAAPFFASISFSTLITFEFDTVSRAP